MKTGIVVYFSKARSFGYIQVRELGSTKIEKYFLHATQIVECIPKEIEIGCIALFEISDRPSKKPTDVPYAISVTILDKPTENESAETVGTMSGVA